MEKQNSPAHWDAAYGARSTEALTWFEPAPQTALALIAQSGLGEGAAAIDVGAGASDLALHLLDAGFDHVTRLDLSGYALAASRRHLPPDAPVRDVVADVTDWTPPQPYDLWHDRAAFHFLTAPAQRAAYRGTLLSALRPGGFAVIASFAPDGPEKCSALPVCRYDAGGLMAELGTAFTLIDTRRHEHITPKGNCQPFTYVLAQRRGD